MVSSFGPRGQAWCWIGHDDYLASRPIYSSQQKLLVTVPVLNHIWVLQSTAQVESEQRYQAVASAHYLSSLSFPSAISMTEVQPPAEPVTP